MASDGSVVYFERQWVPWWVIALFFGGTAVPALLLVAVVKATVGSDLSFAEQVLLAVICGLFMVLVVWGSAVTTYIRVDDQMLKVRGHGEVPLNMIEQVAVVRGEELHKLRRGVWPTSAAAAGGVLTPLGGIAGALGDASMGAAGFELARKMRGLPVSFWMHEAVALATPQPIGPSFWLIGSRRADELGAVLRDGAKRRRADIAHTQAEKSRLRHLGP
jgi:hypothetical protein